MASAIDINDRDKLSSLNTDAYGGSEAAKQFVLQGISGRLFCSQNHPKGSTGAQGSQTGSQNDFKSEQK